MLLKTVSALLVAGFTLVALAALGRYPGSAALFVVFTASYLALGLAALPRPRLYAYTVLAALLILGLWAKTMVHTLWRLDFLEPVGNFGNSAAEWDAALVAMSVAAFGVLAIRCAHIWFRRRRPAEAKEAAVPPWFTAYRGLVWGATLLALVVVNLANLEFAFYQIGVHPKLLLPFRLHVVLSWLVNIGFALWIATLVWWDCQRGRGTIVAAFVEALLSSVSAFSRIIYLVHAGPYWLAFLERRRQLVLGRGPLLVLAGSFIVLFVASLFVVFWLRATHYPANADLAHNIRSEVPQLVLQRWTGLEGALAISAAPGRRLDLLARAITESPRAGSDSVYQRIARSRYQADAARSFAFASNAGPVALLLLSGSLLVVFAGMALLMLALVLTEELGERWTANPFLLAVGGAALANVVSQTTFFYLTLIFALQLWLAIALFGAIARLGRAHA